MLRSGDACQSSGSNHRLFPSPTVFSHVACGDGCGLFPPETTHTKTETPTETSAFRRFAISAANAALGLAFLPFASIYHPSQIEVAKAQIRQQEDVDEDDNGDPETSEKHLLRQLRRIRRGEKVETLFLRRE